MYAVLRIDFTDFWPKYGMMKKFMENIMVLMKVFNAYGQPVVYEVAPNHVGTLESVRKFGAPRFIRDVLAWLEFTPNGAVVAGQDRARALDEMTMNFAQPDGWGFQIEVNKTDNAGISRKAWSWVRPSQGEPYRYEEREEAEAAAEMCYGNDPHARYRVHAHGWRSPPENKTVMVTVRAVTTPVEEDECIEGVYEFSVDAQDVQYAGDVALDTFHEKNGIEELDDFEISAIDGLTGQVLPLQEKWNSGLAGRAEYFGKISDDPYAAFLVEVGKPGGLLYKSETLMARDEQKALEKFRTAWGFPEAGLNYQVTPMRSIENKKGVRP